MPISGEVEAINEALADDPELLNNEPYQKGWRIAIRPEDAREFESLKNKGA